MATSAELAGQIQQYDQNKVTTADALNQAMAQYGAPEIRQTVANTRTTLANTQNAYNQVDPSVTGRTSGSLVTEAQRTKQVANERAPIAGQIGEQSKLLGDSETSLHNAEGQATQVATARVNDYNTGRAALQSQYDDTYKTEQDAATREATRQAEARAQQNADRQYALQQQSAANSGSKATTASLKDTQASNGAKIAGQLQANAGSDGYVSRATFGAALSDFQANGGTTRQFWQQYGRYANRNTLSAYAGYYQR